MENKFKSLSSVFREMSLNRRAQFKMKVIDESHNVHVDDGRSYDSEPHEKDIEHVNAGVKKHGGEFAGYTDKGVNFKFKNSDSADQFKKHVRGAPHRTMFAEEHIDEKRSKSYKSPWDKIEKAKPGIGKRIDDAVAALKQNSADYQAVLNGEKAKKDKNEDVMFGKGPPDNMSSPANSQTPINSPSPVLSLPRINPAADAVMLKGKTSSPSMPSVYGKWPFTEEKKDTPDPKAEKMDKSIKKDGDLDDAKEIKGGKTDVDLEPETDDSVNADNEEDKVAHKGVKKANMLIGQKGAPLNKKVPVKESTAGETTMNNLVKNHGLSDAIIAAAREILEKKLTPKQKDIAGVAGHPGKIDAADLAALRSGKKITEDKDQDHFGKQSQKMQDAINLHLRNGKNYKGAVKAAMVHVKEETRNTGGKLGDHQGLIKYTDNLGMKHIDRHDLLTAASHMAFGNESHLAKHVKALDTDVRDKVKEYLSPEFKKRHLEEEVEQIDEQVSFKKTESGDHHIHHNGKRVGKITKTKSMGSLGYSVRIGNDEAGTETSLPKAKESAKYHLTSSESPLKEQEELDEAAVPLNHKKAMINHYGPGKVTINKKDGMISHTGNGETNSHAYDPNEKQPIGHHVGTITVAEEVELDEAISKMSDGRLKWHINTGVPHGSYTKDEMKKEKDHRLKADPIGYRNAKPAMKEEVELDEANSHREVNNLKSKGKHHEAGVLAAKSGHLRQYGPHFGMRSGKEEAQRQFFKGYDSVKKTNEEAEIDEALGSIDNFKKASKFGPERVGAMIRGEKARKAEMAKVSIKRPIGHRVVAVGPNQTEKEISKQNFEEEVDHKKERSELINKAAGHNIPSKMREKIRKAADLHGMAAKDPEKYAAAALAASKALNEEDDGWYAHHEIHGSKGISKEDWKKGVRMNSKGERVKTTKEEAERIDELSRTGILQRYSDKTRRLVDRGVEEPEKREKMRFLAGKKRWGSTGGIASAKVPATNEEVEFSDAEIARIEAILNTVE